MQVHGMYIRNKHDIIGYEQTGCVMSMTANRLSFFYSFRGPSKTCEPLNSCLAQPQSHASTLHSFAGNTNRTEFCFMYCSLLS